MNLRKKYLPISLMISIAIVLFIELYNGLVVSDLGDVLHNAKELISLRNILIVILMWMVIYCYCCNIDTFNRYLFKYRYIIMCIFFLVLVAFKITGSSIGVYCDMFRKSETGVLLGVSRPVRSDEWAVSTPMLWSQYQDSHGRFSYFSSVVRGTSTDVFLEYGQPVKSIFMIFRPFYIGYLFLPVEYGMAFFWCGRLICLFMSAFEFGRLLTGDDRKMSLVYAFMVAFSPVVQWWFAINGLVEMLICIQLSIVLYNKYLTCSIYWRKTLLMVAILVMAGTYILTMYPSWQVPFAYVLIGLIIWQTIEHFDITLMHAKDWISLVVGIAILGILMYMVFAKSSDTIDIIMNTEYPGKRFERGGGMFNLLFELFLIYGFLLMELHPM